MNIERPGTVSSPKYWYHKKKKNRSDLALANLANKMPPQKNKTVVFWGPHSPSSFEKKKKKQLHLEALRAGLLV